VFGEPNRRLTSRITADYLDNLCIYHTTLSAAASPPHTKYGNASYRKFVEVSFYSKDTSIPNALAIACIPLRSTVFNVAEENVKCRGDAAADW